MSVNNVTELNYDIAEEIIEKLKKGEPVRYDKVYERIDYDSMERLKDILKAALKLAEDRVVIYGCLYTEFWKDFYEIFKEIHDRGVEVLFILDPRCKEKLKEISEELPWIREVGKLMIGAETTEVHKHFELVDNKFLRLEKPHEVPLKKGDIIENMITALQEEIIALQQKQDIAPIIRGVVPSISPQPIPVEEIEEFEEFVETIKPWLETELLDKLVFSKEDLLPIEECEYLSEVEDRIKVILPKLLKDVLQKIWNKISEYDADIDVSVLEDPVEGTPRFIVLIVGDFNKTLTEKVELEDEIEDIIDDVIESWKESAESEIDKEIIESIGLLIDVLIQDRHPKDSEILIFIDLKFTEKDLEDKLEDLIKLTGDEKKAKEIKEKIRKIVIEEVKKSGKPYDDSGIEALTNLLCSVLIKEVKIIKNKIINDL